MKISIIQNRNVQLCAYGLIASGYDLYDHDDVGVIALVDLIHKTFLQDTSVKSYFAWARSGQISVNPYWPKGSGVVTASLFVDINNNRIDLSKYLQHEQQSASNMVWKERSYQQWISMLPEIITIMDKMALSEVDRLLQEMLGQRSNLFQAYIDKTASILDAFGADSLDIDDLIYIPNILLAPELTDFVHIENNLYVLAAEPRVDSMIHELLHHALHDEILRISEMRLMALVKQADLRKLQELGYSWDSSQESTRRLVEESIVRCMTALLGSQEAQIREGKLQWLRQAGFIVPDNLMLLACDAITLGKTKEFIATM